MPDRDYIYKSVDCCIGVLYFIYIINVTGVEQYERKWKKQVEKSCPEL